MRLIWTEDAGTEAGTDAGTDTDAVGSCALEMGVVTDIDVLLWVCTSTVGTASGARVGVGVTSGVVIVVVDIESTVTGGVVDETAYDAESALSDTVTPVVVPACAPLVELLWLL